MNLRHLATKGFDSDIVIRRSIVYPGSKLSIGITHVADKAANGGHEDTIQFNKAMPDNISLSPSLQYGKELLLSSPIQEVISREGGDVYSLSACYDYVVPADSLLSSAVGEGVPFDTIFESEVTKAGMVDIASEMFPNINPNTGKSDIDPDSFYAPYVPLVTLTGCMTPQVKDDVVFFNPDGVVTVAEFLDGLNAIKYGCNANNMRRKTLDNISTERDYFNEGYNSALRGISSPFFNLYTRAELMTPITRLELAYITVICWSQFMDKYNSLYGGSYYLGITFDWEVPHDILSRYEDGFDYKVSRYSVSEEHDVISLDIKDYRSDRTMEEYREALLRGVAAIPLPMFMSMLELGVLDLFMYENRRLDPLKEVSRGELCYFLARIAKHFPTKRF